jgi:hypothetical protein
MSAAALQTFGSYGAEWTSEIRGSYIRWSAPLTRLACLVARFRRAHPNCRRSARREADAAPLEPLTPRKCV